MAEYALWLTDDAGRRLTLLSDLNDPFFFNYTRAVSGLGTFSFGVSFRAFKDKVKPYFVPDRRIEVWRSPAHGIPMRREDVFMLRKPHVYTRDDNVQVIQFYGRNGIDLLNRRYVIQIPGSSFTTKTDNVDDMMKAIVREQMLYGSVVNRGGVLDNLRALPLNEFFVQADLGLGPSVSRTFTDRKVFDIFKDLKDISHQLNVDDPDNRRIFFDVVPKDLAGISTPTAAPLGWEFQTFADLRGADRTNGIEFSLENENIEKPSYSLSHLDEVNVILVRGGGSGKSNIAITIGDNARVNASRWNRSDKVVSATSETSTSALTDVGSAELHKGKPQEDLFFTFLNTPGGAECAEEPVWSGLGSGRSGARELR